jgi:hypothetical protein
MPAANTTDRTAAAERIAEIASPTPRPARGVAFSGAQRMRHGRTGVLLNCRAFDERGDSGPRRA